MKNKDRKFLGASIGFGFLSAACCILPLLAALFGLSFLSALAVKIERFRWVFIILAILFLVVGCFWLYREKKKCACLSKKKLLMFLIVSVMVLVLVLFPYILGFFLSDSC